MSSKKGNYSSLKFCPYCGVGTLQRDWYLASKNCPKAEYLCSGCGFGFRIMPSARVELANSLHAEVRQLRTCKFEEKVSPEVRTAFEKEFPEDKIGFIRRLRRICRRFLVCLYDRL